MPKSRSIRPFACGDLAVTDAMPEANYRTLAIDGGALHFLGADATLLRVPAPDAPPETLFALPGADIHSSLARLADGRWLASRAVGSESDIVLVEGWRTPR